MGDLIKSQQCSISPPQKSSIPLPRFPWKFLCHSPKIWGKVDFLKKVLDSRIEKDNRDQNQPQLYKKADVVDVAGGTRRRSLRSTSPPNVSEIIQPSMPIIPHGPSTTNEPITQEIHQKTMESHHEKLRSELFGLDDPHQNLRKRNLQDVPNDLDDLMKDHQQSQEQVAEEMLSLTKTLKEQSIGNVQL